LALEKLKVIKRQFKVRPVDCIIYLPQHMRMYFSGIINITNDITTIKKTAKKLTKGTVKLHKLKKKFEFVITSLV
jgi:hypothetical protein